MRDDIKISCSTSPSLGKEPSALPQPSEDGQSSSVPTQESSGFNRIVAIGNEQKPNRQYRRYQLHLWISEKEYTMLKEAAELHDEPMSRIVRRLFSQLKYLNERKAG